MDGYMLQHEYECVEEHLYQSVDDVDLYNLTVLDRPLKDWERFELFRLTSTTGEDAFDGRSFD